jgi:hypothetical protein
VLDSWWVLSETLMVKHAQPAAPGVGAGVEYPGWWLDAVVSVLQRPASVHTPPNAFSTVEKPLLEKRSKRRAAQGYPDGPPPPIDAGAAAGCTSEVAALRKEVAELKAQIGALTNAGMR